MLPAICSGFLLYDFFFFFDITLNQPGLFQLEQKYSFHEVSVKSHICICMTDGFCLDRDLEFHIITFYALQFYQS